VKFLLWVVPAVLFVNRFRRERPLRYLGVTTMPTLRQWAWCLAVIACFLAAVAASEMVLLGRKHFALSGAASYATAPGLLLLCATPLFEETLFRGLFVKEMRFLTGPWSTVVVSALLFAGIHLPFWIWRGGPAAGVLANAGGVFVFGLVAASLYLKTSSIWPPTVAHVANNLLAAVLVLTVR
jgi:membrane protease YdiL (CAAX protease family)